MFTIDKSYSMTYAASGDESSKWMAAKAAITKAANDHYQSAAFGVQVFPRAANTCDSGEVTLSIGAHSPDEIEGALGIAPIAGNNTPIAQTLEALLLEDSLSDALVDRHVILVTDGWQYCGEPHDVSTRFDAVAAIDELRQKGVTVHVVGFGGGVDSLLLNRVAVAAGTSRNGCDPTLSEPNASGHCYLVASDAQGIEDVLSDVTAHITQELCDGHDNDCDGVFDEDFDKDADRYSTCGTLREEGGDPNNAFADCDDSDASINIEAEELCDGIDNNCDGMIDEGCECEPGEQQDCGSAVGACQQGRQSCGTTGWGSECFDEVLPSEELCDNIDNDCDAQLDEDAVCPDGLVCWSGECAAPAEAGPGCGCAVGVTPRQLYGWAVLIVGLGLVLQRRRRA